ncbi:MAG: tetratricopeptide repeat protein [Zoogloeaceae bacterium]|nr:tetratricopeptide repeat protein [Zoogloeaceae bacterium]
MRSLAALLCFSGVFSLSSPVLAETLPEIQQILRQGQYAQALEKINAYLIDRPKDAQGRFLKGLALTELKRGSEAILVFTQLSEDYPELPEPYNNLAVLYAQQKQYDRARAALEMAIRTHPSYAIAYENLGDVYAKLASQAYDRALQLDTSNATAQSKLALIRDLTSAASARSSISQPVATVASVTPAAQPAAKLPPPAPAAAPTVAAAAAAAVPAAAESARQEIAAAIASWAEAWSKQDVKGYLAHYAPTFRPAKNMRRADWEAERAARIRRPAWIKLSYTQPVIRVDGNEATAQFQQTYQAPGLKSGTRKTLLFTRIAPNTWRILSENSN